MILTMRGTFGSSMSLDLTATLGPSVELQCFQFAVPPIEFRLVRQNIALQEWQPGNTEVYDLQHGPGLRMWCRDEHWFINDLNHRANVTTCGVLSKDLVMQTRGLALQFVLLLWPRETTFRARSATPANSLTQLTVPNK
jgi:hypothetical protein